MSPGQTGHVTGQMGRVPGTDGTHTRGSRQNSLCLLVFLYHCKAPVAIMAPNFPKLVSKFWKLVSERKYALTSRKYPLAPRKYALTARKLKKKAHKLKRNRRDTGRVSLGHQAGQTEVYRQVSQGFPVVSVDYYRKTDILPGHRPGVPGTPSRPRLRWAEMRGLKTDTRVSKRAF